MINLFLYASLVLNKENDSEMKKKVCFWIMSLHKKIKIRAKTDK